MTGRNQTVVRVLVIALLALALSGCVSTEDTSPDLIGICPHWEPGTEFEVLADGTTEIGAAAELNGKALDRYWLQITKLDGELEMRVFANGTQRPIQMAEGSVPVLRGGAELVGEILQISLTSPAHGTPANAGNITVELNIPATFTVTPMYRVCGL
jgi:hypothetical protein